MVDEWTKPQGAGFVLIGGGIDVQYTFGARGGGSVVSHVDAALDK